MEGLKHRKRDEKKTRASGQEEYPQLLKITDEIVRITETERPQTKDEAQVRASKVVEGRTKKV